VPLPRHPTSTLFPYTTLFRSRFKANGRTRDMGLGSLATVSLAEARELAAECRRLRLSGMDPIESRKAERVKAQLSAARSMTFDRSEEHTSELQSRGHLVCRLL